MASRRGKTALILAGGGTMGAAYEIGVLSALERALRPDFSTTRFDMYVGISAGAIIATLAANQISPHLLFRAIANNEQRVFNWKRSDIYRFDFKEVLCCSFRAVGNFFRILRHYRERGWSLDLSALQYIFQEQFPSGLFSLEPMQNYLCNAFKTEHLLDDFNLIRPELYIPAYDLDLGERVVFGSEGFRDMHICQAITASCAIPHFFRPCNIHGRHYLDGSTGRAIHLDIAVEQGAELIVLVNPRVPLRNDPEHFCLPSLSFGNCASIADLGISIAQEQARRIESREKISLTLDRFRDTHPNIDIVLIEPEREESVFFFQNPMSMTARNHIMAFGYHLTLSQLRTRFSELQETFHRHGITLNPDRLEAPPPVDIHI
ncbi:MAG: hypothetical protein C0624_03330 [Desulfuromonas sp.]|nr:MAG: hypothetical protein C0624_03330 [Desulfuromonas sp.]